MTIRRFFIAPGTVFSRLTVIREGPRKNYRSKWLCQCECGQQKLIDGINLKKGLSRSCGCLRTMTTANRTHGQSKTVEYKTWSGMKKRCYNPRSKSFKDYGQRGITVAPYWLNDFPRFLSDMGHRPPGGTLERINNNGPYAADNCRWAQKAEQGLNTRRNRRITFNGETLTLSQWASRLGESSQTLTKRLARGWSIEQALMLPGLTDQTRRTNTYLEFQGERLCVAEWARRLGVSSAVIFGRLKMGWSLERTLTTPVKPRR